MTTTETDRAASDPAGAPSARTRIRRLAENARYDRAALLAIVDATYVCHIAFHDGGQSHCIPTACWRRGEHLYVHGSNGSRLLRVLQSGAGVSVSITHVDGLVLARSAFNHSMNYRSVVLYGSFETVNGDEKVAALADFMAHLAPGRQGQARPGNRNELAATTVLRVSLDEAAAKVRTGGPQDDAEDLDLPVWAGVLPLTLVPGPPARDAACNVAAPDYVLQWKDRTF